MLLMRRRWTAGQGNWTAGRRRWRAGSCAALLAGVALAGCGSSHATSSTTPGAGAAHAGASARACSGSQLAASYAGTEGATGHLELTVALRNVSRHFCLVRGYPSARLLDAAGRALPLRVTRGHGFFPDTEAVPAPMTLKPGAKAHFGISFVTNNEFKHAHVCRTASAAMSAAPGARPRWQRVSLRSAPRISPCGNQLVVSPVHA
jgi:hypothetical protein